MRNTTFADLVALLINILNSVVFALIPLALVLFMWGVVKYIYKGGGKDSRTNMLWGLLALFVLFSVWGLVRIACNTFLGEGTCGGFTGTMPTGLYQESGPYPQGSVLPF